MSKRKVADSSSDEDEEEDEAVMSSDGDDSDEDDEELVPQPKKRKAPTNARTGGSAPPASAPPVVGTVTPKAKTPSKPASSNSSSAKKKSAAARKPTPTPMASKSAAAMSKPAAAAAAAGGVKKDNRSPPEAIFNYLVQTNRPYGAINVFDNLHKTIGKATVQSTLDSLADKERISTKVFGKAKIYWAKQEDSDPAALGAALESWTGKGREATATKAQLAMHKAKLEAEVRSAETALSNERLEAALQELTEETSRQAAKVETLRASCKGPAASQRNLKELQAEAAKLGSTRRKRRRELNECLAAIADMLEKPVNVVKGMIGWEDDPAD